MMTNASFIFYRDKEYGQNLDKKTVKELLDLTDNKISLKKTDVQCILYKDYFKIKGTRTFKLATTYPGLISGSGYNHPSVSNLRPDSDTSTDFQLGFYFDHTTGMPVIPGSTVKGVLKSVFPKEWDTGELAVIKDEKLKYINNLIRKKVQNVEITEANWEDTFLPKGAVFHDAYISGVPDDGRIFAEDYITPHKEGLFKNPIPLRFLKIAPEVTFTFQFTVKDTSFDGTLLTVDHKLHVFKQIILDFGLGAKRNVGYGNFTEKSG